MIRSRTFAPLLMGVAVLVMNCRASDEAAELLRQLHDPINSENLEKSLERGETFLATYPDHPELARALHHAAKAGTESSNFKRASILFRKILATHPGYDAIDEVRFGLAQSLSGGRELEACIQHCQETLAHSPDIDRADYFRFLIPQSQFRLWRFREAEDGLEVFLEEHPRSSYAAHATRYLERINPTWEVDKNGTATYSGKYEDDYRFKAAFKALPEHISEGRAKIRERLGVDIDFRNRVNFIFRDSGEERNSFMAQTFTICRDYQPVTVIRLYAEHVVIDPAGYRRTVIHEMKHAGFKAIMGRAYDDVPDWIAEGLAQWAAEELDYRIGSKLTSETFAGKDPLSQLNGVANPDHDVGDYLEDVLAFEWMEQQKPASVKAFSAGLIEGEDWRKLLAATSGVDTEAAIEQMDRHCQQRVAKSVGRSGRRLLKLRDVYFARGAQSATSLKEWLREEGNREFAEWVERYPDHPLAPVARFYSGRGLILTGSFAKGREWLRALIDSEEENRLADDALFWEGYAFQQEERLADATRSFGILLRDYSWSNSAPKIRGKFEPAGPERKPSGS